MSPPDPLDALPPVGVRVPWWGRWFPPGFAILAVPHIRGRSYPNRVRVLGIYPWLWLARGAFELHSRRIRWGFHPLRISPQVSWTMVLLPRKQGGGPEDCAETPLD